MKLSLFISIVASILSFASFACAKQHGKSRLNANVNCLATSKNEKWRAVRSSLRFRGGKSTSSLSSAAKKKDRKKYSKKHINIRVYSKEDEEKIIKRQKVIMQVHGALISLGSMYLSRKIMKIDYKNPVFLKNARLVFVSYLIFAQLLYFLLKFLIKLENNKELVPPKSNPMSNIPALAGNPLMKLVEGFGKQKANMPMTVKQYDLQQNKELLTSLVSEIVGVTFLHLVFKMGTPLLMVPMWGITNRLKSPLILIRLFGMKPFGQFARPFKSPMELMMSDMMSGVTATVGLENDDDNDIKLFDQSAAVQHNNTLSSKEASKVSKTVPKETNKESENASVVNIELEDGHLEENTDLFPMSIEDQFGEFDEISEVNKVIAEPELAQASKYSSSSSNKSASEIKKQRLQQEKNKLVKEELTKKLEEKMKEFMDDLEKPLSSSHESNYHDSPKQ